MLPAVTVSLLPELRQGPFVFCGDGSDLAEICAQAAELGFAAIELFPPDTEAIDAPQVQELLEEHGLVLAAVGSGSGWFRHRLSLTSGDEQVRQQAIAYIRRLMAWAAPLEAPVIIGAMQGKAEGTVHPATARRYLGYALFQLDEAAEELGVTVLYEPLNRYESNLIHTLADAAAFLRGAGLRHVRLLADLFHMNIEESDLAGALRQAGPLVAHVHFSDSNRRAAGWGHTDFAPIIQALREIGYRGYLSAEVLPVPDSESAARQAITAFHQLVGPPLRQ
jgi:sugar phosphate isomerase/epimerase